MKLKIENERIRFFLRVNGERNSEEKEVYGVRKEKSNRNGHNKKHCQS
jgi:uncharacterized protein YneR